MPASTAPAARPERAERLGDAVDRAVEHTLRGVGGDVARRHTGAADGDHEVDATDDGRVERGPDVDHLTLDRDGAVDDEAGFFEQFGDKRSGVVVLLTVRHPVVHDHDQSAAKALRAAFHTDHRSGSLTSKRQPGPWFWAPILPWCASTSPVRSRARVRRRSDCGGASPESPRRTPVAARHPRMPPHASSTRTTASASVHIDLDGDRAAHRRVANGVGHKVAHDTHQFRIRAAHDRPLASVRAQRHVLRAERPAPRRGHHVADHIGQPHVVQRQLQRARRDPRQLEQVVDHLRQVIGLARDLLRVDSDLTRLGDDTVLQRLGHRPDPGQRRPQVVTDPRHQLPARGLGLPLPHGPPRDGPPSSIETAP